MANCHAYQCKGKVALYGMMCSAHWAMISPVLRSNVIKAVTQCFYSVAVIEDYQIEVEKARLEVALKEKAHPTQLARIADAIDFWTREKAVRLRIEGKA